MLSPLWQAACSITIVISSFLFVDKMAHDCITIVPLTTSIKLWAFAIIHACLICLRILFFRLWKKTDNSSPKHRPISNHINNNYGKSMYIKINGVKLHYVEKGVKSLPLILLLHGFPDCWIGWRHQIDVLSKHFRVVALDLKGFGDSDKPQWRSSYDIRYIVEELAQFIDAMGVDSCHLVGHDLGALVGWFLSASHPQLIRKFVSIACPHPNIYCERIDNMKTNELRFLQICLLPYLPESLFCRDNISMIDFFYAHLHKGKEDDFVNTYKYFFSRREDISGPLHYIRNIIMTRLTSVKILIPTLMLVGASDDCIPVKDFIRSSAFLESSEIKIVENSGHFPQQEEHSQVNQFLLDFFLDSPIKEDDIKQENNSGIIGNLLTNTLKYGNSLVNNVKKTTNGVVSRSFLHQSMVFVTATFIMWTPIRIFPPAEERAEGFDSTKFHCEQRQNLSEN